MSPIVVPTVGTAIRSSVFGLYVLALAGCVTAPSDTPPPVAATPTTASPVAPDGATPSTARTVGTTGASTTAASTSAPATKAEGSGLQPVVHRDPATLQALAPVEVEGLIGPPSFVRHDGGAIIWQYNAEQCVMDLFWYRTESGLSLVYLEARGVSEAFSAELDACLGRLLAQQAALTQS